MDHYNVAVFDGQIVTTRRRFGYARQVHQGTTFVHSSVPGAKEAGTSASKRAINDVTFVTGTDGRKRSKAPRNSIVSKKEKISKVVNPRSTSKASDARFSSPGPPDELLSQKQIEGRLARISQGLPIWSLYELPGDLPDSSKRLFHICLSYGPLIAYPFYELGVLSHNPLQGPQVFQTLLQSPATIKFSITLGALYQTVLAGRQDSPDLVYFTSKLYSLVNEWLQVTEESVSNISMTINAISILAVAAVRILEIKTSGSD
jgi:hypothetical protein